MSPDPEQAHELLERARNGEEVSPLEIQRALLGTQEELHPDLKPWVEESETFGKSIKHPILYSIVHHDAMNAMMNHAYEQKRAAIEEAYAEERWGTVLLMHERPYRLWAFRNIEGYMPDDEYWKHLGETWTDSENIWQNEDEWLEALSSERGCKEQIMDEDERKALYALPSTLTIYRGFAVDGRDAGLSWSLNRERAVWFARRLASDEQVPRLVTGTVDKSDVIAHFLGRGEEEIVVLPENVEVEKVEDV